MQTPPLLNETTQESTTYDRFSKIVFNNRLGSNPSVLIQKDRVALIEGKSLLIDSKPFVLSVNETNIAETIEFMGEEYSYEWIYGFMNTLCVQVIEKLNQSVDEPLEDEENPETGGEELPNEE
jgi:hypothetical protein